MLVALLSSTPPVSATSQSQSVAPATVSHASSATSGEASTHVSAPQTPASVAEYMVAAAFTTSFKGKDYTGTVEQANGVYTGAVANLPGADAAGASIQGVEISLGRMVDTLA